MTRDELIDAFKISTAEALEYYLTNTRDIFSDGNRQLLDDFQSHWIEKQWLSPRQIYHVWRAISELHPDYIRKEDLKTAGFFKIHESVLRSTRSR